MFTRTTFALALLGALVVAPGCGGKNKNLQSFDTEQLATDPAANFVMGVQALQNPDRKNGIDYQAAYDYFVTSVQLDGGPKAAFNAGWVAEVLGRPDDAARHYQTALEADPTYRAAMFSLASVLYQIDRPDDAVGIFRQYLDGNADDLEVRNELIVALTAAGKHDEALAEAHEILRHDPENVSAYRNLSAMYYAKGEYGMSQLTNEKALQLDDADPGTYNNMGVTYLAQDREADAIDRFKTAVQLDSEHFEANTNLGYIALNSGDYTLARTSLEAAVARKPSSVPAKMGLAVALRGAQEYDRAGNLYDEIIVADPDNAAAYYNASLMHEVYTRDFDKALSYLQQYVDANAVGPNDPVFERMDRVKAAKSAEEERQRLEAERKKAEEERRKRNEAMLAEMSGVTTKYTTAFETHSGCLDAAMVEEGAMILEQVGMVVEMEDAAMAADIKTMLEAYTPTWDEAIAACEGGGTGGSDESDAGGTEDAPAE